MTDFHGAGREGEQPFSGEGLQDCLCFLRLGWVLAGHQLGPGGAAGGVHAIGGGSGQPGEDLPCRGLLGGGETVVGALGAVGDGAFDAAGPFVVSQAENVSGAAAPGLVKGMRQQRQYPGAGRRLAAAHLSQEHVDQVIIDARTCALGWFGDGHPQLSLGHRGEQVAVLDRISQLRIAGAPGLEIGAHPEHYQRCWCLVRPGPGRRCRV